MQSDLMKKRTFLICGHAQSGKTSLAETILFKSGAISRLGKVDSETSTSDYEEDEKRRKSSINLSVLGASYKGNSLQFIDTPGYLDFVGELITSSQVVDFAVIVVDALEGVGVGTEKAWNILREKNVPCLFFINKLDKDNTDYKKTLDDIKKNLTKNAVSMGIVEGDKVTNALKDKNASGYSKIVEMAAESDDGLVEKYLETGELTEDEFRPALKKAILNSILFPIVGGMATQEVGIDCLLDLIVDIMPAVGKSLPRAAKDKASEDIQIEPKVDAPFSAQVFKTVVDPFVGQLTIFRVFSGQLNSNSEFYDTTKGSKEKFGQLYSLQGKQQSAKEKVFAGDIAAVAKLKNAETQDTICDSSRIVEFPKVNFPS
ncbi:MAG: GTP-binding protein, partial [Candidatus Omnitrophica bacterium]|nr:GTP-binding protein [Candidatus Omnitrophota bacterium]